MSDILGSKASTDVDSVFLGDDIEHGGPRGYDATFCGGIEGFDDS